MNCKFCGAEVNDFDSKCSNCGNILYDASTIIQPNPKVNGTPLLIFSIIEFCCVNQLFGLISLILYLTSFKPKLEKGDIEGAKKSKKTIITLLIIGLVLFVLMFTMIVTLIAVPNVSGIQHQTQVRADSATAAQIGKAVRVWYTEVSTDPYIGFENNLTTDFIKYDELNNIEKYINQDMTPNSYKNYTGNDGAYYVAISSPTDLDGKIIVAIGPENFNQVSKKDSTFLGTFDEEAFLYSLPSEYDYSGLGSGIVYVEP